MDIQRLAAFTQYGQGGNPAGVVIADTLPEADVMLQTAADVGYSETVFAAPQETGFRVRYFAPGGEVPFCGHATIALGAAMGAGFGVGDYSLALNETTISVAAHNDGSEWSATLTSPKTYFEPLGRDTLAEVLALFDLMPRDLDPAIPPMLANGGAQHLVLPLARHDLLRDMNYDFDAGAALMQRLGLVTINLIWRDGPNRIFSRNAFAGHGVYEDPATGAAAAALAGYLRDGGIQDTAFEVVQGVEMGAPSRLFVRPHPGKGAAVEITGATRIITS